MRTEKEIKERIKYTKEDRDDYINKGIETLNYMTGWLNALEWVLSTASIKVDEEDS